jgi:hypothetical protein
MHAWDTSAYMATCVFSMLHSQQFGICSALPAASNTAAQQQLAAVWSAGAAPTYGAEIFGFCLLSSCTAGCQLQLQQDMR